MHSHDDWLKFCKALQQNRERKLVIIILNTLYSKKNVQRSFSAIFRFLFFNQAKLPFMLDCRSYVLTSNLQRLIKSIDCNIANKKGKSFHSLNSINLLIQALSKVLKDCKLFATLILIKTQFYSNRGENRKLIIISKFQLLIPVLSEHFRFLFILG